MIDIRALRAALDDIGIPAWSEFLSAEVDQRLSAHGDFAKWYEHVAALPATDSASSREHLLELAPWRKGPFDIGGVAIDSEWRSDLKWARVKDAIQPLADRNVLDVGCGNGYYALQMADAGARHVVGIDPTVLFVMQFLAVNRFEQRDNVFVVPARLEEMPLPARSFDTAFSMGVLYHRRSPVDHLRELHATLRPGGQLVLETIFLPGDEAFARTPKDRYARMRNVWLLPTIAELRTWLDRSGFSDVEVIDQSMTTTNEQRSTEWMTFESLREALDPSDSMRTVEGWPAPHRVVVTAIS